jgi:hypothetical protein
MQAHFQIIVAVPRHTKKPVIDPMGMDRDSSGQHSIEQHIA